MLLQSRPENVRVSAECKEGGTAEAVCAALLSQSITKIAAHLCAVRPPEAPRQRVKEQSEEVLGNGLDLLVT